jgi:hypothetical protein
MSDRALIHMAQNDKTFQGSRSLAHVLDKLLQHASPKGVSRACEVKKEYCGVNSMKLFLIEYCMRLSLVEAPSQRVCLVASTQLFEHDASHVTHANAYSRPKTK